MCTYLNNKELEVVKKVVQHNAHMAHNENILLCDIMDENQCYRKFALEKYFKQENRARNQSIVVINLQPPPINFKAENYWDLIFGQQHKSLNHNLTFVRL